MNETNKTFKDSPEELFEVIFKSGGVSGNKLREMGYLDNYDTVRHLIEKEQIFIANGLYLSNN